MRRSESTIDSDPSVAEFERVVEVCDRFEAQWRRGQPPRIEEFLARNPSISGVVLFRELLTLELELARAGETVPSADEYRARFPDRTELVDAVFAEATSRRGISQPPAGAGPKIDDVERRDDGDLRASLGAAATRPVGPGRDAGDVAKDNPSAHRPRERFRILRFHREGGLGRVYLARDEELGREVALKEIRPDKAAEADLRGRFVLEAEINGGLEHPGIVPVYSLGAHDDGRPFYAMRFVEGDSLKEAIDSYHKECPQPDPSAVEFRKLLARFIDVCEAIAFAHSKGVLHRDLKPHNVMLGRFGETLLIDWGLAKATGRCEPVSADAAGSATLVPPSGSGHAPTLGMLGSPLYMSPEQAVGESGSVGPSTDVYGLGAILFELLTGEPPVEGKTTAEIVERARLGAIRSPRSLNLRVPRSLEAVCLKALAPEPGDRYPTALALAEEVEHWLADEPVTAWRESRSDRARRWAKRHRTAMTGGLAAVLAGFVGLVGMLALQVSYNSHLKQANAATSKAKNEAERALTQSEEARKRAEAVLTFLKDDVLAAARPEGRPGGLGPEVTVRQAVNAAEPRIAASFRDQPIVEADVRITLGQTYWYLGEAQLAIRQFERALELYRRELGPDHPNTLNSRSNLGSAYWSAGRIVEAIEMHEATLRLSEVKLGPDHSETLITRTNLAAAYLAAGRTAEAIEMNEVTLKRSEAKLGPDDPRTLASRNNLASSYMSAGRSAQAIKMLEATLKLRESELGPDHPETLNSRNNLAVAYSTVGRTAEAIKMHEATLKRCESKLGPDHLQTLQIQHSLAAAYLAAGRTVDAIKMDEATLKLRESKLGPDHPGTLQSRHSLASDYHAAGRAAEAIKMREATLKLRESKLGADHPETLQSRDKLAQSYSAAGRTAEAIKLHEETLKQSESKLGSDHPDTLQSRNSLANAYMTAGRAAEAIKMHEVTLKLRESKLGSDHPETLKSRNNLAACYWHVGRTLEAIKMHELTLKLSELKLGPEHPDTLRSRSNLAAAYFAAGRTDEAIKMERATLKLRETTLGRDHPDTLFSRSNVATAYLSAGRTAEAIEMHEMTLKVRESNLGSDHPDTLQSRNELAKAYRAADRFAEAIKMDEVTLRLRKSKLGPNHPLTLQSLNNLTLAYESVGRLADAEPLERDALIRRRKVEKPDSPLLASDLAKIGMNLLKQSKWSQAEPVLRECLAIRQKALPDDWSRFNTTSQIGAALLGQSRYAEAEALVIEGYMGMKARAAIIPPPAKPRLAEAEERVIRLYEAWGKPAKTAEWRIKLGLADLPADVFARP